MMLESMTAVKSMVEICQTLQSYDHDGHNIKNFYKNLKGKKKITSVYSIDGKFLYHTLVYLEEYPKGMPNTIKASKIRVDWSVCEPEVENEKNKHKYVKITSETSISGSLPIDELSWVVLSKDKPNIEVNTYYDDKSIEHIEKDDYPVQK